MPDYETLSGRTVTSQTIHGQIYVLRLWHEPEAGQGETWRASLLNPLSQQRRYFSSAVALTMYLAALDPAWPEEDDILERAR